MVYTNTQDLNHQINYTIRNNTIYNGTGGDGAIMLMYCSTCNISDNIIFNISGNGININYDSNYSIFQNNLLYNLSGTGIFLSGSGSIYAVVNNNSLFNLTTGLSVGGKFVNITNNTIIRVAGSGISLGVMNDSLIANNFMNNTPIGIIAGSNNLFSRNVIANNTITNTSIAGYVSASPDNIGIYFLGFAQLNGIENNTISNSLYGVLIENGASDGTAGTNITNNTIFNTTFGILVYDTNSTNITRNTIRDNKHGIFVNTTVNTNQILIINNTVTNNTFEGIKPDFCMECYSL